jgi:hypothetical protein
MSPRRAEYRAELASVDFRGTLDGVGVVDAFALMSDSEHVGFA